MLPRALARSCQARLGSSSVLAQSARSSCPRRLGMPLRLSERRYTSASSAASSSSPPSSSASTSASEKTSPEPKAASTTSGQLPPLSRPLGVEEPPTTYKKTWRERTLELMDQDVRMERRRHLVKEATKGYYADLHAVRRHGGKTWLAPKTLIREDHALYFPNISGAPLDGSAKEVHTSELCRDKVAVIAIRSSVMSEEHVRSFLSDFPPHPSFLVLHINLQPNPLHSLLLSLSLSSLRRSIPANLHSTYLLSSQNMEYLREPMGMDNKHIGYVYLVDQDGKIRWAGGGLGTEYERDSLKGCVDVLLGRLDRSGKVKRGEKGGS